MIWKMYLSREERSNMAKEDIWIHFVWKPDVWYTREREIMEQDNIVTELYHIKI